MRILFLGPLRSSFASVDVDILRTAHQVETVDTILGRGSAAIRRLVSITLQCLWSLPKKDRLYCWFADYHTVIPVLFARLIGKRVVVVAGGYDIGYEPQINFGAKIRTFRWLCVRTTFRWASEILAVSEYANRQLHTLTNGRHAPSRVVYNAVRTDLADDSVVDLPREQLVVTVSQGESDVEVARKGIDVFVRVAQLMPDVRFRLIGLAGNHRIVREAQATTPNLEVYPGFVSFEEVVLPSYYAAGVYAQLSIEEAFGVAVTEAMTCGCIPVTTGKAALSEVVGSAGIIAQSDHEIVNAIREGLAGTSVARRAARARGMEYDVDRRARALLKVVSNNN